MVHNIGYQVFSSSCCCHCLTRKNYKQEKPLSISRDYYAPVNKVQTPAGGKEGVHEMTQQPRVKFDSEILLKNKTANATNSLRENETEATDEVWKQIVNQHDHERMEKEIKKLESRIKNLGKVRPNDKTVYVYNNSKSSMSASKPKCTFL